MSIEQIQELWPALLFLNGLLLVLIALAVALCFVLHKQVKLLNKHLQVYMQSNDQHMEDHCKTIGQHSGALGAHEFKLNLVGARLGLTQPMPGTKTAKPN